MTVMNKTPLGTILASRWDNGVKAGIYKKGNAVSLEYNENEDRIELLINDDAIRRQNIHIRHVTDEEFGVYK